MECQAEKLEHLRHILLFEFNREAKAAEAATNICAVYRDNAVGESTAIKLFSRFKKDCFEISGSPRSGRPSWFDEDRLNTLIHKDPHQCTRELANVMNCNHSIIVRHFHSMGKVQKSGVWVPHVLSQNHKNEGTPYVHLSLLIIGLARKQHRPFLSFIFTGDEKWCHYANIRKIKQ